MYLVDGGFAECASRLMENTVCCIGIERRDFGGMGANRAKRFNIQSTVAFYFSHFGEVGWGAVSSHSQRGNSQQSESFWYIERVIFTR